MQNIKGMADEQFEERLGSWDENPERGPNARVNQEFEEGAYRENQGEEETIFGVHVDPEEETEWEMQFEKQIGRENVFQQENPAVQDDSYELTKETVTEDLVETEYAVDIAKVDADEAFPAIAAMDAESIETVLNAAYQELDVEAYTDSSGLKISVQYDGHDSLAEGVSRVMEVYRSFDEILKADEKFETM
jgi:hypothetical protein